MMKPFDLERRAYAFDLLKEGGPTLWQRAAAEPGAACLGAVGIVGLIRQP